MREREAECEGEWVKDCNCKWIKSTFNRRINPPFFAKRKYLCAIIVCVWIKGRRFRANDLKRFAYYLRFIYILFVLRLWNCMLCRDWIDWKQSEWHAWSAHGLALSMCALSSSSSSAAATTPTTYHNNSSHCCLQCVLFLYWQSRINQPTTNITFHTHAHRHHHRTKCGKRRANFATMR